MQIKEKLFLNFQRSGLEKSAKSPMQMRQSPGVGCHPKSEVCQENIPSCPLSFVRGVEVSFGEEHTKGINGNEFGIKAHGIVGSLQVEGSAHCAGMVHGKNEEGEGSKVVEGSGTPREEI